MSCEDGAEQVGDSENNPQMTLDEYKEQCKAKKKAAASVVPKLNIRVAGEGEDPRCWVTPQWIYRKANIDYAAVRESEEENGQKESTLIDRCQVPYASSDDDDQQSSPSPQPTHASTAGECQQTPPQHPYLRLQGGADIGTFTVNYPPLFNTLLLFVHLRR